MKFGFIAKHRGIWPVLWMCEALGVSRGGFYAWLTRPRSQRSRDDDELGAKVRASFLGSDRTYGARRVWRDLLTEGISCGLHRIERLMRLQAVKARPRRRRPPAALGERQAGAVAPNVLGRSFEAAAPNCKWIADFTYVWTAEGWLFVAAVIDLFSRRVVGWSMSAGMTAQLVTDALVMAIWRRGKPDALLHHSDRGSQYSSEQFQRLILEHGIVCSMSRSGNVWDNAAMESFFSSLKTERTARKVYRTRDEAKADVFDYIERFYNLKRRHSKIGYLSPMDFEMQAGLTEARVVQAGCSANIGLGGADGASDTVVLNATNGDDAITITNNNGVVTVTGLDEDITISSFEAKNDRIVINGLGGDDVITASGLTGMLFTANGGDGD